VAFNGIQIALVYMDEKWFWSIVVRRNLKCAPFLGAEPAQRGVQHESHLEKVMGIASTAFAPEGNGFAKGGLAFLVNLVHVGRVAPAARGTRKRIHRADGTHRCPKIPANRLQKKGDLCFKFMETTGSNPGTEKSPKFDVLSHHRDTELPKLDQIAI
jgi:hypothetical protein